MSAVSNLENSSESREKFVDNPNYSQLFCSKVVSFLSVVLITTMGQKSVSLLFNQLTCFGQSVFNSLREWARGNFREETR